MPLLLSDCLALQEPQAPATEVRSQKEKARLEMSGGSYDYLSNRIEELALMINRKAQHGVSCRVKRLAFVRLLDLCAKAAHDIEWVDSGDSTPGDEEPALDAVLEKGFIVNSCAESLRFEIEEAKKLLEFLERKL